MSTWVGPSIPQRVGVLEERWLVSTEGGAGSPGVSSLELRVMASAPLPGRLQALEMAVFGHVCAAPAFTAAAHLHWSYHYLHGCCPLPLLLPPSPLLLRVPRTHTVAAGSRAAWCSIFCRALCRRLLYSISCTHPASPPLHVLFPVAALPQVHTAPACCSGCVPAAAAGATVCDVTAGTAAVRVLLLLVVVCLCC